MIMKRILAITCGALIIASWQNIDTEAYIAANTMATPDRPVTDTVPKDSSRRDTMQSDTAMRSDTATYSYLDLRTGQPVDLYYSPRRNRVYSVITNEPVDYYVNVITGDTVYGRGRYVVNNYLVRSANGMYKLDDKRIKIDKDEIKMKDGKTKFKIDKGEMKMKDGDNKMKDKNKDKDKDEDDAKMKTEDMKMKEKDL